MNTHTILDSPLGPLTLVNTDGVMSSLSMGGPTRDLDPVRFGQRTDLGFEQARDELVDYFAGQRTTFDVPIAPKGDPFEQRVWRLLLQDPVWRDPQLRPACR